jgi:hypothetical protein
MVMVLQQELNKERDNFFLNRPDFGARRPSEAELGRLQHFYHQQGWLAEMFDSLRESLAGPEEEPLPFPEPDGTEEEGE